MGDASRRKAAGTYPDTKTKPVRVVTIRDRLGRARHAERDEYGKWRVLVPRQRITDPNMIEQLNALVDGPAESAIQVARPGDVLVEQARRSAAALALLLAVVVASCRNDPTGPAPAAELDVRLLCESAALVGAAPAPGATGRQAQPRACAAETSQQ